MASHRGRSDRREYRVSDPRQHPQGFTEYRVTARIISKKTAEVKEVTVFKRYSDFKKLHSELSYIHRNLFRKLEEFPAFPKAQVFGRFDEAVIEERRRCAEEMLQFTVDVPALNNSPQLKDFFKDGETCWPLELAAPKDVSILPQPLIPLPSGCGGTPGSWPQPSPAGLDAGQWSEAPPKAEVDEGEVDATSSLTLPCHAHRTQDEPDTSWMAEDEAHSLRDSGPEAEDEERGLQTRPSLPDSELALFDPCAKEEVARDSARQSHLETLSVPRSQGEGLADPEDLEGRLLTLRVAPDGEPPPAAEGPEGADYLSAAAECIREALEREAAKDYGPAFTCYRNGVDILLKGLQGEQSAERQDAIKKRTAEYLKHAEVIFALHLKDSVMKDATPPS